MVDLKLVIKQEQLLLKSQLTTKKNSFKNQFGAETKIIANLNFPLM